MNVSSLYKDSEEHSLVLVFLAVMKKYWLQSLMHIIKLPLDGIDNFFKFL